MELGDPAGRRQRGRALRVDVAARRAPRRARPDRVARAARSAAGGGARSAPPRRWARRPARRSAASVPSRLAHQLTAVGELAERGRHGRPARARPAARSPGAAPSRRPSRPAEVTRPQRSAMCQNSVSSRRSTPLSWEIACISDEALRALGEAVDQHRVDLRVAGRASPRSAGRAPPAGSAPARSSGRRTAPAAPGPRACHGRTHVAGAEQLARDVVGERELARHQARRASAGPTFSGPASRSRSPSHGPGLHHVMPHDEHAPGLFALLLREELPEVWVGVQQSDGAAFRHVADTSLIPWDARVNPCGSDADGGYRQPMARRDASALHGPEHVRAYRESDGEYGHDWRNGSSVLLLGTDRPPVRRAADERAHLRALRRRLPRRRLQRRVATRRRAGSATSRRSPTSTCRCSTTRSPRGRASPRRRSARRCGGR